MLSEKRRYELQGNPQQVWSNRPEDSVGGFHLDRLRVVTLCLRRLPFPRGVRDTINAHFVWMLLRSLHFWGGSPKYYVFHNGALRSRFLNFCNYHGRLLLRLPSYAHFHLSEQHLRMLDDERTYRAVMGAPKMRYDCLL